jgi:hypothetical protein
MPSCPFVQLILQSNGQKAPKSGAFKNEGIHEVVDSCYAAVKKTLTVRLYQISQSVTLWLFPNRQRSDSTWRTREFRHDRCSASERF